MLLQYCVRGTLQLWDDSALTEGRWEGQLAAERALAGMALFLVATDFCDSEYIRDHELPELLTAHQRERVGIFWVAVSDSAVDTTPLAGFQCLNDPRYPLDTISTRGKLTQALNEIARKMVASLDEAAGGSIAAG